MPLLDTTAQVHFPKLSLPYHSLPLTPAPNSETSPAEVLPTAGKVREEQPSFTPALKDGASSVLIHKNRPYQREVHQWKEKQNQPYAPWQTAAMYLAKYCFHILLFNPKSSVPVNLYYLNNEQRYLQENYCLSHFDSLRSLTFASVSHLYTPYWLQRVALA